MMNRIYPYADQQSVYLGGGMKAEFVGEKRRKNPSIYAGGGMGDIDCRCSGYRISMRSEPTSM